MDFLLRLSLVLEPENKLPFKNPPSRTRPETRQCSAGCPALELAPPSQRQWPPSQQVRGQAAQFQPLLRDGDETAWEWRKVRAVTASSLSLMDLTLMERSLLP